jgi:hypothetical protein
MIPYDDLVTALQAWRAKRGLPVAHLSGSLVPPPAPPAPAAKAAVAAPVAQPGSGRTAKPAGKPSAPPPPRGSQPVTQTTQSLEPATDVYGGLAARDHNHDETEIEAESAESLGVTEYSNEDEFAQAFDNLESDGESTSVGAAPAPAPRSGGRRSNDDW